LNQPSENELSYAAWKKESQDRRRESMRLDYLDDGYSKDGRSRAGPAKRRHATDSIMFLKFLLIFLPWWLRRRLLKLLFGYDLHPKSRIGKSWVYPRNLIMKENARIGHFNLFKGLDHLELGENSSIGHLNWITAHPFGGMHFRHVADRSPSLILAEHSSITSHHFLDCANRIGIGKFTTIAGVHSQFFTQNLDVVNGRQDSRPIEIGSYCLIATGTVILPGSVLPDYSVLSAMSLLNKRYSETHRLYAGVPAVPLKPLPTDALYFTRTQGHVE
jgi:acetyltransferase-like isoleucine patch superfamily enzyme